MHTAARNPRTPQSVTCNNTLQEAAKLIAATYHGDRGTRAYALFEQINAAYFDNALPWPLILWAITPHGGCLGLTLSQTARARPPVITLHPSLLQGTEKANPWSVDPAWLGWRYALDVLIHECIHVSVNYRLGGSTGATSHNCSEWIAEVNRLAPLLGLEVTAAMSKTKRVRDDEGISRVVRGSQSTVPFRAIARFPGGVREALGTAHAHYTVGSCDTLQDVTG